MEKLAFFQAFFFNKSVLRIHNIIYDVIYDLIYDLIYDVIYDVIYDLMYEVMYNIMNDKKTSPGFAVKIDPSSKSLGSPNLFFTKG